MTDPQSRYPGDPEWRQPAPTSGQSWVRNEWPPASPPHEPVGSAVYGTWGTPSQPSALPHGPTAFPYPVQHGGYPIAPPAPKRRSRIAFLIVTAVVVVVAVCAGGVVLVNHIVKTPEADIARSGAPLGAPTTAGTAEPTPTPTPSAAPKTKGGLLYSKIAAPPVGSADLSLSHGIDGVFTAKQITKQTFGSSKTEAATLATEEFVVAAGREYQREDGVGVRTFLLEFKNFYGAESLYDQVSNGRKAQKTVTGTFHVAGGSGFEWSKPDDRGDRWSEMYKRVDNIVIFLYVYTPGPISVPTDQKLLSVQVKLLA